jgi:hypothetical protein
MKLGLITSRLNAKTTKRSLLAVAVNEGELPEFQPHVDVTHPFIPGEYSITYHLKVVGVVPLVVIVSVRDPQAEGTATPILKNTEIKGAPKGCAPAPE